MESEGLSPFDLRTEQRPEGFGDELVFCPFCLWKDKRRKFEVWLKSGKLSKEKHCPHCNKTFYDSSLVTNQTSIAQYVKFVVGYPMWFRIIDYEKWSQRMKELNFISEFWVEYRKLKPKEESQLDSTWD